ncbi:hypothetical protein [Dysgonomonas sp. ZJ279]|uniref:hypothetical protein n=1 Tax=Dysgonomonas sp. ZJ279 TaxID=2709796 RepID=UPI0013EAB1E4|nr:hypothetical protein [Dysgonomonas sp. ZJ279]
MARSLSTQNLFDKKPKRLLKLTNPVLREAIGPAERKGCWILYGLEKNGKTWLAGILTKDLAINEKVWYISAEEGTDESFKDGMRRAGVTRSVKVQWDEYLPMEDIIYELGEGTKKRAGVVIIDNLTMYVDEIKPSHLKKNLIDAFPDKLFILIAHEERKEPDGALARMAKKIAKVILHTKGLTAFITSRHSRGGALVIDEEKSIIFWGDNN